MDFRHTDWIHLVKRTREKFGVSLDEAHDLIFADDEVRRLVARRINDDPECRKLALNDLRRRGEQSRFMRNGDRITIDAAKNILNVDLSDAELAKRRQSWRMPPYKADRGTLAKYIRLVKNASLGCVTDEAV